MKNLFNPSDFSELQQRWNQLTPDSKAVWGKMNAHQVIVHCTDPLREALGIRPTKNLSNLMLRTIGKLFALYGPEWQKGKFPTSPDYDQQKKGTTPIQFSEDRNELLRLMDEIKGQPKWFRYSKHPAFGTLSRREWGILCYRHMDHHLRQFGV